MKSYICDSNLSGNNDEGGYNDDDVMVRNLTSRVQITYVYLIIIVMQEPCLCLGRTWSVTLANAFLMS